MNEFIKNKLLHAVTEYDRKQSTKKFYNIYALAQYLMAVERASEYMVNYDMTLREALLKSFNGRLLDVCLKAAGEPTSTKHEQLWGGR